MKYLILYDNSLGLGLVEVHASSETAALNAADRFPNILPLGIVSEAEMDRARRRRNSDLRAIGKPDDSIRDEPVKCIITFRAAKKGWVTKDIDDATPGVMASSIQRATYSDVAGGGNDSADVAPISASAWHAPADFDDRG